MRYKVLHMLFATDVLLEIPWKYHIPMCFLNEVDIQFSVNMIQGATDKKSSSVQINSDKSPSRCHQQEHPSTLQEASTRQLCKMSSPGGGETVEDTRAPSERLQWRVWREHSPIGLHGMRWPLRSNATYHGEILLLETEPFVEILNNLMQPGFINSIISFQPATGPERCSHLQLKLYNCNYIGILYSGLGCLCSIADDLLLT